MRREDWRVEGLRLGSGSVKLLVNHQGRNLISAEEAGSVAVFALVTTAVACHHAASPGASWRMESADCRSNPSAGTARGRISRPEDCETTGELQDSKSGRAANKERAVRQQWHSIVAPRHFQLRGDPFSTVARQVEFPMILQVSQSHFERVAEWDFIATVGVLGCERAVWEYEKEISVLFSAIRVTNSYEREGVSEVINLFQ